MDKKISNETWKLMFGSEPSLGTKRLILQDVKDSGCDIREAVAKYVLPKMMLLNEEGKFHCEGHDWITPEQWQEVNPLKHFARCVILRTQNEKQ